MKKRFLYLLLPIVTLILEILPYGAVCNFARPATDGSIGRFRELYSYFDLIPFGYANFAPLLTAIITLVIIVLLVIYVFSGKHSLAMISKNVLFVCTIFSLGPLVLGISFYSLVGALITITLLSQALILHFTVKK